jgi:hypothetical protein
LLYFLTHQQVFSLVPVQSRAQITHYAVHPADGKVHVHRDRCPDVFQHHIALDRFGLKKRLIDQDGYIFLSAWARACDSVAAT